MVIIGLVPKMGKEFLVQIPAGDHVSTIVNVVGVATTTEGTQDTIFDFETLHQPMLTNTLVTVTDIKFSILQPLPILLELFVSRRLPELQILHCRTFSQFFL